ncbi:MAG: hypothetical protein IKA76_00455, partial [Clostridia bacterium]|nr:hypothetical protein [Clostridia bacterium]
IKKKKTIGVLLRFASGHMLAHMLAQQRSPTVFNLREKTISFYTNYDEEIAQRSSHNLYESFCQAFF